MSDILAVPLQISNDGTWSLGIKIGLPICIIVFIAFIWGIIASFKYCRSEGDLWVIYWAVVASALIFVGVTLFVYYPFDAEHHQFRDVTGTVASKSSRIVTDSDTGSTDEKFVVTFRGSPQQFGITDTRGALVKVGQTITISCKKEFVYGGEDGYDCNWGSNK